MTFRNKAIKITTVIFFFLLGLVIFSTVELYKESAWFQIEFTFSFVIAFLGWFFFVEIEEIMDYYFKIN